MPIPFKLDYVIERTLAEQPTREQRTLKTLAGARISASEARVIWPRLQEHKWYLSERLGRDVGLRVAAVDYFENIHAPLVAHSQKRALSQKLHALLKPLTLAA
ncbi:MAG TPA: DUF4032 domain-containing protein [Pyrinomonadaceae bacterium]|jgi:hypothetical protein